MCLRTSRKISISAILSCSHTSQTLGLITRVLMDRYHRLFRREGEKERCLLIEKLATIISDQVLLQPQGTRQQTKAGGYLGMFWPIRNLPSVLLIQRTKEMPPSQILSKLLLHQFSNCLLFQPEIESETFTELDPIKITF